MPSSEFVVSRTKVSAYYANLAPKSWFVTDIKINSDFEDVLQKALRWHYDGCKDIRIDFTIFIDKDPS